MKAVVVLTTTSSNDEAKNIAKRLVNERIVACANVIPGIESIYRWEGKVCDEKEWLLLIKTTEEQLPVLKSLLQEIHSYECPELIVLPIVDGLPAYLEWLAESTSS